MITFNRANSGFELKNKRKTSAWIKNVVAENDRIAGDITFVFMNDDELLDMNRKYLKHNTLTDIITFNYNDNQIVSGDICISIDRVRENAATYKVDFLTELNRVMIHGVLHLIGFKDKTDEDKKVMRDMENRFLAKLIV